MKYFIFGICLASILIACQNKPPGNGDLSIEELRKQGSDLARTAIASELKLDTADLLPTSGIVVEGPLTNEYYYKEKFLDPREGIVYSSTVGKNKDSFNELTLLTRERKLYDDKYGKLEPALIDTLSKLPGDKEIRVGIWLKHNKIRRADRTGISEVGEERQLEQLNDTRMSQLNYVRETVQASQQNVVGVLNRLEKQEIKSSRFAPLIFVNLNEKEIRDLAEHEDVTQLYLGRTFEEEHDSSIPTLRADDVHALGIRGDGVGIAIVENNRVPGENPFLNVVATRDLTIAADGHAAHTGGDAASSHGTLPGVAPDADIFSAVSDSYDDDDIIEALDWAVDQNVHVINCSFGFNSNQEMELLDRYFDFVVRNEWVTITKSAGNRGSSDGNVTSPGLAWNIITVGGINDQGNSDWSDDTMYSSSSFKDPKSTHGDREKPEVCAVGRNVKSTTTANPWVQGGNGGSGTSFAAPMVAGAAALIIDRNWSLRVWPEVVKAIIMSGSGHNIEGSRRLSEFDGAGAIDVSQIDEISRNGMYQGHLMDRGDFDASGNFNIRLPNVTAGERLKATICWDSQAFEFSFFWFSLYLDFLAADFDLSLYDPDGNWVAGSFSWDNSFETIDITAAKSGVYTLRIHRFRMDSDWEWLGVAWHYPSIVL